MYGTRTPRALQCDGGTGAVLHNCIYYRSALALLEVPPQKTCVDSVQLHQRPLPMAFLAL